MKISNTKTIVAALIICSSAALAGSVSSSIAWYQYSTRATAIYLGASAGAKGSLKLRIKGTDTWLSDLTYLDIADYLRNNNKGQLIVPITSGPMNADDAIKTNDNGEMVFYQNPDGGIPVQSVNYDNASWKVADDSMYASIPLEICFDIWKKMCMFLIFLFRAIGKITVIQTTLRKTFRKLFEFI